MIISKDDIMTVLKIVGFIISLIASFKGGDFLKEKESNEQIKNLGIAIQEVVDRDKCENSTTH